MIITQIQHFSLQDGPGIRTTVFFKGCSIHCPWCCNPENINTYLQTYKKDDIEGIYGKEYSTDELYFELLKDQDFYVGDINDSKLFNIDSCELIDKLPGGVTFSGGEALLQMETVIPLCKRLHEQGIHLAIETSLFASLKAVQLALECIDLFYVDIKILGEKKCKRILSGDLSLYINNLEIVLRSLKPVVLRIPVINGYTDDKENRRMVINYIRELSNRPNNVLKIELLKEHSLGLSKYMSLKEAGEEIVIPSYRGISDDFMDLYFEEIKSITSIPIEICKI